MRFLKMTVALPTLVAAGLLASLSMAGTVAETDVVFEDGAVSASLTGVAGDPAAGRDLFKSRKLGNCLACHQNTEMTDESFHGEVGPSLDGVADVYTEAELRGIVANSKMRIEDTIMPAFYVNAGFERALEKFDGKSILTAQEVEDVVAYLMTLKE